MDEPVVCARKGVDATRAQVEVRDLFQSGNRLTTERDLSEM